MIALCIGCMTAANAQTFTQRLQQSKAGEGKVTVSQSQDIDNLVNGTATAKDSTKAAVTAEKAKALQRTTGARDTVSRYTPEATDTTVHKKVMRGGYKTTGYRVQVFAGGNQRKDRQQATRIGSEIKSLYPNLPVYVHFYSPRWICRVGNFRTYEEAHQLLTSIRKMGYNAATVIKDKITVYRQ